VATRLDKTIKRELDVSGKLFTVSVSPQGIKIVPKGSRKGYEISWEALLSGEVELRQELNASLAMYDALGRPE
jgi:hypothetical protein